MFENYLDRKQITLDLLHEITHELSKYVCINLFTCGVSTSVFIEYKQSKISFDNYHECYEWLLPIMSSIEEFCEEEYKRSKIYREILVDALYKIQNDYDIKNFAVSIVDAEQEARIKRLKDEIYKGDNNEENNLYY